jgi:signal peptide peptidase SppA
MTTKADSDQQVVPELGGDSRLEESLLLGARKPWTRRDRSYVLHAFMESPWAILPRQLIILQEIVVRHVSGEKLEAEEIEARVHGARRPVADNNRQAQAVAVLPLFGTIFPRANLMTEMSGATSAEIFSAQFSELLNDPNVSAIVIDVDSPGGHVDGIQEVSQKIFEARSQKPIVAVANHLMASAAYWIGTAAEELVASPSSEVGSVGVFAVHQDISRALDQEGIKVQLISAGKYKVEGNPYEALGEEARSAIQARVSDYYDSFVESVARNRGVKVAAVRSGFGEGRVVGARQAVELGMADRVGTLEETIERLLSRTLPSAARQADGNINHPDELASSDSVNPDFEHEAQRLRDYVELYK